MLAVTLNSKVLAADQGSEREPANHAGAPDPLLQLHQLTPTHLWRVMSGGSAAPTLAVPGAESGRKHANALPLETADDAAGFLGGVWGGLRVPTAVSGEHSPKRCGAGLRKPAPGHCKDGPMYTSPSGDSWLAGAGTKSWSNVPRTEPQG